MARVPPPAAFRRLVDDWVRLLADTVPSTDAAAPAVEDLVVSVFRAAPHWIDIQALDERLQAWSHFDLRDVQRAIELIANAPTKPTVDAGRERSVALEAARQQLSRLERLPVNSSDGGLSMLFTATSHALEEALSHTSPQWDPSSIVSLTRGRLATLRLSQLKRVWGLIRRECRLIPLHADEHEDDSGLLVPISRVMDRTFFDIASDDVDALTCRIARYMAWLRPRLIDEGIERGRKKFPHLDFGLAGALAMVDASQFDVPSEMDWTIARSIGLLSRASDSLRLWRAANELLSLDDRGPILSRFASAAPRSGIRRERELLFGLSMLLTACELALAEPPSILRYLRWYKLRMEVSANEILDDFAERVQKDRRKTEVDLQRDIVRFLLSHGVYAVGTRFGRSETDLVLTEVQDTHLIEVKVYDRPPTAAQIEEHFPQVNSYWEEFAVTPKTKTLVIFNRSGVLLRAPREVMVNDLVLIFINMMDESPSKRRGERYFRFVDGSVIVEDLGSPIIRPPRRRTRNLRTKTRRSTR